DARIPGGDVSHGARTFSVDTPGGFRSVDEVRATLVGGQAGSALTLGDVADVRLQDAEVTSFARFNGQRAVFVTVTERDKQNIFDVRDRAAAAADDFARTLPAGVTLQRGFDQSANVGHRLG